MRPSFSTRSTRASKHPPLRGSGSIRSNGMSQSNNSFKQTSPYPTNRNQIIPLDW